MTESSELSRRWFLRLLSGGTLAMTLAGCGGGDEQDDDLGGGNNGGGNNGGGNGGGQDFLTGEALFAGQSAISAFTNSLPAQDMEVMQQSVLNFVRGRGDVKSSGLMEGGVWAVFNDGFPHVILLNRVPRALEPADTDDSRAAGTGVPKGGNALLMNAMVSPGYADEAIRIAPALSRGDYNPQSKFPGINDLRSIGTPSFFFYSSHGGDAIIDNVPYFVLSTATDASTPLNDQLRAEARAGLIASMTVPGDPRTFYGITQRWISRFWRFAPGSLVWISACSSQSAAAQIMVQACLGVGAGAVAGYTDIVESNDSDRVQRFMLDRLVGANVLSPREATPQRPFDYDKLLADLAKQVGNSFPVIDPNTRKTLPGKFVSLKITKGADNFGLLAPSIAYALIDEYEDKLILKGTFGLETDGKVFIEGVEMAIFSWAEDEIRCQLPRSGAGSAGGVQVVVRGHKSNTRRITRWTIEGKYFAQPEESQPLVVEGTAKLIFRADIGEYRNEPGKVFIRPTRYALSSRESTLELTAKGVDSQSCGDGTVSTTTWSGTGSWETFLPNDAGGASMNRGVIAYLSVDTINKTGALSLTFALSNPEASPFRITEKDCDGTTTTIPLPPFPPSVEPIEMRFPTEESDVRFPVPGKTFAIGGGWDVPGDRMETPDLARFEWNTATPEFPPDPKAARSR